MARFLSLERGPGRRDLAQFTHQLAILLRAGVPVVRALEVLARQQGSPVFRRRLEEVVRTIRAGRPLSQGLAAQGGFFDRVFISMVRAGESSGALPQVLERLAGFQDKALRTRGKIAAATTYPVIVMLVSTAIVAALLMFVVPRFQEIFADQLKGQPLPALTRAVIAAGEALRGDALMVAGVSLGAGMALGLVRRSPRALRLLDRLMLRLPILGGLVRKVAIARFAGVLGTLLASGVPILQALQIAQGTAGNRCAAEAIAGAHRRVTGGDSVARSLSGTALGPDLVVTMIEVGEEVGALPEMFSRIAETYEDEVDNTVLRFTTALEPALIVLMALVVGTIVIALFLPMVEIVQVLG